MHGQDCGMRLECEESQPLSDDCTTQNIAMYPIYLKAIVQNRVYFAEAYPPLVYSTSPNARYAFPSIIC
jgi:hypothetical protein